MNPGVPVDRADMRRRSLTAAGMLLVCCSVAFAQNPALDVSQYAHTAWKVSEGFAKGVIRSIAQTSDGYLWVGTDFGLLRFDGVRAVPWQPPQGEHLPGADVRRLLAARDGRLWIGTFRGLASWKDGKLTHYPELEGQTIQGLIEDREGTVWVGGWKPSLGRLCRIQSGNPQCYGEDGRFGNGVTALHEDKEGNLWAGGITGLWRWKPGPPRLYPLENQKEEIYALSESDDGGILVATRSGITKLKNGRAEAYPLPAQLQFQPNRLLRDRHGGLWIGTAVDMGLLHIHEGRTDLFTPADGLSGGAVSSLLEDREGNIWVSTHDGLDRFRVFAVPTMSVQQGLSSRGVASILAARDGSMWLGTSDGLNRWNKGQITIYRTRSMRGGRGGTLLTGLTAGRSADSRATVREITDSGLPENTIVSLFEDAGGQIWVGTLNGVAIYRSDRFFPVRSVPHGIVISITGDRAGNIWISHQEGLFQLRQARVVERIPWAKLGRREPASALLHDAMQGGLWLGFRDGGVALFKDGQLRASYAGSEGLTPGMVRGFYIDRKRTLWAATVGGLNRIQDGRVLTLTSRNGLPCDMVHWMMEDDADSVWLYLACGLVRIARAEFDAWASDPKQQIRTTVFDSSDGVRNLGLEFGYSSVVAKSSDGRLWFLPFRGVSIINPHHLAFNKLPPPVDIHQIVADRRTYDTSSLVRLPPLVRDLQIDYTALSLVAPEKNRFRIKLEGRDSDWQDVGTRRQAFYTDLGPGTYHFRVVASNNSGVWNEAGAALEFSIAPAYYQTRWFQAAISGGVFALLWVAYGLRIRQVARQFNRTLDARVSERTRIARELHDTLLQSFHGLLLQFQTAAYLLPERPAEAREQLDGAIVHAANAITEGRNAVQSLRTSTVERNDLAVAIRTLGEELARNPSAQPLTFSVGVEGETRDLHPIARDEIFKVAAEALRNAYRHAHASRVEVEIRYNKQQLRLRVRDDGRGIDPAVLAGQEVEGHYGLRGMSERATLIGGRVTVWSEAGAGTEVELVIPARAVYAASVARSWWSRVLASKMRAHVERDGS
jgi:signal transduction histidine kinase/ligand-binding sensor domain-containing protein